MTEKSPFDEEDELHYRSPEEEKKATEEKQKKKILCCLAYFLGLLFFLPLIFWPNDDFAKFHANQSLVILLASVISSIVCGLLGRIPGIGVLFGILGGVIGILLVVACVLGILSVVREEKKALPLLGLFHIIK